MKGFKLIAFGTLTPMVDGFLGLKYVLIELLLLTAVVLTTFIANEIPKDKGLPTSVQDQDELIKTKATNALVLVGSCLLWISALNLDEILALFGLTETSTLGIFNRIHMGFLSGFPLVLALE